MKLMLTSRAKLLCAMMACACALVHAGCMAPWAAPPAPVVEPTSQPAALPHGATSDVPFPAAAAEDAESRNLAGVLDKLQQVRAIDPAAEQRLIDELQKTPAASWPLVAEQFRSSLAYREQLTERNRRPQPPAETSSESASIPIGEFVDPRGTDVDEAAAHARASSKQYAMQALPDDTLAPAELDGDGTTYSIAESTAPPANKSPREFPPAVQPASLYDHGDGDFGARQANLIGSSRSPAEEPPAADLDWQQLVRQAGDDLTARVAPSPATTAEVHQHASLRMLRLLGGDTESALEPIPNLSPVEQDYWSRQLFALATYLDHHSQPDDKRRAAAAVTHLDEAVSHLRELGSLSLRNLSFCQTVYGYGAIEPYEADRFSPGEELSLYVEMENYHSQSTEKGYCTLVGSSYELLDAESNRVAGGEFPDVDDCCRSRRRDFHIQYGLTLPSTLPPGEYRLQLVVKDRQSDKLGQASVPFEIRGKRP